jgi:hypothetical protein
MSQQAVVAGQGTALYLYRVPASAASRKPLPRRAEFHQALAGQGTKYSTVGTSSVSHQAGTRYQGPARRRALGRSHRPWQAMARQLRRRVIDEPPRPEGQGTRKQ